MHHKWNSDGTIDCAGRDINLIKKKTKKNGGVTFAATSVIIACGKHAIGSLFVE